MDDSPPNYRREFWKSPHHIWFGLGTLGLGFISAHPLGLIAGVTAYVIGWLYLPDLGFFRRHVDRERELAKQAVATAEINEFTRKRDALLDSLSSSRRRSYADLAEVCRQIESASAENSLTPADVRDDPRLRKLDELMWTYLRLLGIEESLERFLESERKENLPQIMQAADVEIKNLTSEAEAAKAKGVGLNETRERLLGSRLERHEVLRKRMERVQQAEGNLSLVVAEQERLVQQIKLIRADALATKNAANLTARIDATVEHLDHTNKWISELDEFKDLGGDMPASELRVGYESQPLPPVIQETPATASRRRTQAERSRG